MKSWFLAVEEGNTSTVEALLNKDELLLDLICTVEEEAGDIFGRSALMIAACKCNEEMMQLLIDRGAEINLKNPAGKTALHIACELGLLSSVAFLRTEGANIATTDHSGATPLISAVNYQQWEVASHLQTHGAHLMDSILKPRHVHGSPSHQSSPNLNTKERIYTDHLFVYDQLVTPELIMDAAAEVSDGTLLPVTHTTKHYTFYTFFKLIFHLK